MPNMQPCPLCGTESPYSYGEVNGKKAKFVDCPVCKKLSFEDGAELLISKANRDTFEKFKKMAASTTINQSVHFSLNHGFENMKGEPQLICRIIDPSC